MQKLSRKQLLIKWFRMRSLMIGWTILLIGSYIGIQKLMHLSVDGVYYSSFLTLFVGSILMIRDYLQTVKRYEKLWSTYENRMYHLEAWHDTRDFIEQGYQDLIEAVDRDIKLLRSEIGKKQEEANDYYTLWTHQIKTPIAAMHLVIQNEKYEEGASKKESYQLLEEELFKIEQYAEMALQYLRIESISKDMVLKSYNLYEIVAEALKKYSICFMGKHLTIEVEPFETYVITDKKWLQFVLEQIISNSIKYTHTGGIRIGLKEERELMISDTGIGIHPEDLPRIFERGFTGFNGRMHAKSTGIGLYLCKKIMNQIGHTLSVESELGKGTSFYIGFPIDETAQTLQD